MNKGLEALESVKQGYCNKCIGICENCSIAIIEKELKAFEIIKNKIKIKLDYSISGTKGTHYFIETQEDIIPITKEEYDLLKEVLM